MRTFATQSLRELLRANPDGLDVGTIANNLDREPSNIRKLLSTMPDTYIDRWVRKNGNPPMAIWCVVVPPENCPRPDIQRKRIRDGRQPNQTFTETEQVTARATPRPDNKSMVAFRQSRPQGAEFDAPVYRRSQEIND
jgi:hypothetical protein